VNPGAIRLTAAARDWAIEHGGTVTIRRSLRHGCCGGSTLVPVAEIGEPSDPREHVEAMVDGVRVFRPSSPAIDEAAPIVIDLAGLWRWRRLVVTGMEIAMAGEDAIARPVDDVR